MKKYQESDGIFFARSRFQRIVRDITADVGQEYRFQRSALEALQYSSEMFITNVFEMATLATVHAGRQTLQVNDMRLVYNVHSMAEGSAIHLLKDRLQQSRQ